MWHLASEVQPAHVLPPLAHIANGPAGLTYFPGTGQLPDKYQDHFFLVDFRGSSGGSGIHSFALKPRGAGHELVDRHQFVWSVLATDCDFGPDGAFYLSDWVEGWNLPNKGRIYKVFDPTLARDPTILQVKKLLAEGFDKRPLTELAALLDHKDMRSPARGQFALAEQEATATLTKVAQTGGPLARLHAIWGLGQVGRKNLDAFNSILPLLEATDAEVRAGGQGVGPGTRPSGLGKVAAEIKRRRAARPFPGRAGTWPNRQCRSLSLASRYVACERR